MLHGDCSVRGLTFNFHWYVSTSEIVKAELSATPLSFPGGHLRFLGL